VKERLKDPDYIDGRVVDSIADSIMKLFDIG
jgi:hypothetical protein